MANQTLSIAARFVRRNQRHSRDVLMAAFCALLVGVIGCTASRSSFKPHRAQVPTEHPSTQVVESEDHATNKEPVAEPAVAANVALNSKTADEANSGRTTKTNHRSKSSSGRSETRARETESRTNEIARNSETTNPAATTTESLAETERLDSAFDRFNAVLSDDIPFAESLPQESLTALADRLRIDALLLQAKQLLESGQLEQASQKAQQAQDLSDKVQIDFAPDEDRPIDLVRRIQGQLEATRPNDDSNSENGIAKSPTAPVESDKSDVIAESSKSTGPSTKEPSSLARIRRDWSTLFRQKKKPTTQDTVSPTLTAESDLFPPSTDPILPEYQMPQLAKAPGPEAFVMANRSVTLGAHFPLTATSASYVPENDRKADVESDSARSDPTGSQDSAIQSLHDLRDSAIGDLVDATRPSLDSNEMSDAMTDFDIAELNTPTSHRKSSAKEQRKSEVTEPRESVREYDWTGLYLGIILSGLLAFGYFRRRSA